MGLSRIAVKKPVTTIMVTLIIILLGIVSLTRIPIDLLPKIDIPVAIVSTSYRGAGPLEIEKIITQPIEQALATVNNIENISSTSSEGNSVVVVEFAYGTDMNFATLEMREKIDMIKGFLPQEATNPMVLRIDPNAMPIMQISLSGNKDLTVLQDIAQDTVKPQIERLEGVASVNIIGGKESYIEVKLIDAKSKGYNLDLNYIAQIIGAENLNLPGGEINKGDKKLTVRTVGEFKSIDEIKNLSIALRTGGVISLNDIADVSLKYKEAASISKTNGESSINVSIQKESGTNTVNVANTVIKKIKSLDEELLNTDINIVVNQAEFIEESIQNVLRNAVIGGVLAILVLYIFLRNIRTTVIIGTAIPVSIIATFILLFFNNITLNLMTLGGLALGIGMLVDNAIVVLENIYRFRQNGESKKDAAIKGAKEVAMAVTASTLTTIAVFIPIVFVGGMTASIFRELALTITLSLLTSLLVSLTLIPMLSSKFLKVDKIQDKENTSKLRLFERVYSLFDKLFYKVELRYKKVLGWSLRHRKTTVLTAVLVFTASIASILSVGAEYFPTIDRGEFSINVNLPQGSKLSETDNIITIIEKRLQEIEEVDTVVSNIGTGGAMFFGSGAKNRGSLQVSLVKHSDRSIDTTYIVEEVRDFVSKIPGADIEVEEQSSAMGMGGFSQDPLVIDVKGDDIDILREISEDFIKILNQVEGTREVKSDLSEGVPEVQITTNRLKTSVYGLTTAQIASSVKNTLLGRTATRYKYRGSEIDVIVKGDERFSQGLTNLKQLSIQTPIGTYVPLNEIADVKVEIGPTSISRDNQVRVIRITSQIVGRDLGSVTKDVEEKIRSYELLAGYSYEFGGENEEIESAFYDLRLALILAVVLVYMILASQFESIIHPFTIMLSVPLAFGGGALGLFLTGKSLSVPALIGFILLAGIVVNNAIVLVDYINTRREYGEDRTSAILNSGSIRLRPILMTTLTTVLGLVPLSLGIGEGAELQAPLAVSVIGGLLLSTLLTLVFVPVVYTIIDDAAHYLKKKLLKGI